jgi:hypothetical protein
MSNSQNKSGNTVIFGGGAINARFNDTAKPVVSQLYPTPTTGSQARYFIFGHSNICDSVTGDLLFACNGFVLYDNVGNVIENGDSIVPSKIFHHNSFPDGGTAQTSIILPKGSNGLYFVFNTSISDSMYDYWKNLNQAKFPNSLLQYHIVDMNANGGLGKVIQKNMPLLTNVELSKVGMSAIRHANGYDWWLVKQGANTNTIYTFLVTKDTVRLDTIQHFAEPVFGYYDRIGQSCFSADGSRYAFASGGVNSQGDKLFIADFDRCYGIINNIKVLHTPLHTSGVGSLDSLFPGEKDTAIIGLSFSANNQFLYVSKGYNIYQYELNEPDSALAWYHVQYGPDTIYSQSVPYGALYRGIDNRIYIGKWGGDSRKQNSVINKPNIKGVGCEFCKKCIRSDLTVYNTTSFANMPDFNLGALPLCFPLSLPNPPKEGVFEVFPNPSSTKIFIKYVTAKHEAATYQLYNSIGQLIISTKENEIDVSKLSRGLYYIKVENQTKKIIIE